MVCVLNLVSLFGGIRVEYASTNRAGCKGPPGLLIICNIPRLTLFSCCQVPSHAAVRLLLFCELGSLRWQAFCRFGEGGRRGEAGAAASRLAQRPSHD
jgi:hypothetical protein